MHSVLKSFTKNVSCLNFSLRQQGIILSYHMRLYHTLYFHDYSSAERDRMMEILRRVEEESLEESTGIEDHHEEGCEDEALEERLAGVDLGQDQ